MTRPMPGPPECDPQASPHESVPFNGGDFPMCDRHNPKLRYRKSKRLTDAECAAEMWAAMHEHADALGRSWFHDDPATVNAERIKATRAGDKARTWHRFALRPHPQNPERRPRMIDHNHPAVEADLRAHYPFITEAEMRDYWNAESAAYREKSAAGLAAALPHLTADDLRQLPQVRALMAEAWDRGVADNERGWDHVYSGHDVDPDDPLAECQTCDTPNPYRPTDDDGPDCGDTSAES